MNVCIGQQMAHTIQNCILFTFLALLIEALRGGATEISKKHSADLQFCWLEMAPLQNKYLLK